MVAALGCVLPDATPNPVVWTDSKSNTWSGRDQPYNSGQASLGYSKLTTAQAVADIITGTLTSARSNRMVGAVAFAGVDGLDGSIHGTSGTSGSSPALTIPRTVNGAWVVVQIVCNAAAGAITWPAGWTHPAAYASVTATGTSDRRMEVGWRYFDDFGSDSFTAGLAVTTAGGWSVQAAVLRPTVATVTYLPTADKAATGVTRTPAGASSSFSLVDDPTNDDTDFITIPAGGSQRLQFTAVQPAEHGGTAFTVRMCQDIPGSGAQVVLKAYKTTGTTPVATSAAVTPPDTFADTTFVLTTAQSVALGAGTDWADVEFEIVGL